MPTVSAPMRARLNDRVRRLTALQDAVHTRWLEVMGDRLALDIADLFKRHPTLLSLEVELALEYVDHGGYVDAIHGHVAFAEPDYDEDTDEVENDQIADAWQALLVDAGYELVSWFLTFDDLREAKITRADATELEAEVGAHLSGAS